MISLAEQPPMIVTPRLVLRALRGDDARAIARGAGDRRVARYLIAVPTPYPVTTAARWLTTRNGWWRAGRGITLAIARRSAPAALLGTISLRRDGATAAELGYWLAADAWGDGLASEATRAIVELGFGELGLRRIYAEVMVGNSASERVLAKLGMTYEGQLAGHLRKGRKWVDVSLWGLARRAFTPG